MSSRFALLALILIFSGCAAQPTRPVRPCPGKETVDEALAALKSQHQNTQPIRAAGQCLLQYRLDGKDHKENFPVKIWTNPPDEIYLQGDVAFDAMGLVLGSNADEFWFWLKPREINSYWWGKWFDTAGRQGLVISPAILLEAFGAADVSTGDWSLTRGQYDILWLHNEQADLLKRAFIERCDYLVAKIEYFDSSGDIAATAQFSEYKKINADFYVPTRIEIAANDNSAKITLSSVEPTQLNNQQRQRLFVRPKPQGFNHVYKIVNGSQVEQVNE